METGRWSGYLGTGIRKGRQQTSLPPVATAPLLDSTKKVPPSKRMQISPVRNQLPELSLRVLSCPRAPSMTCVPAELRLNWVNVARVVVGGGQSYWPLEPVAQTAKPRGVKSGAGCVTFGAVASVPQSVRVK